MESFRQQRFSGPKKFRSCHYYYLYYISTQNRMHTLRSQRYNLCPKKNYFLKTMRMRTCTSLQDVNCWAGFLVNTYGFIHWSVVQPNK